MEGFLQQSYCVTKDRLKFTQKEDFIGRILTRASNEMNQIEKTRKADATAFPGPNH